MGDEKEIPTGVKIISVLAYIVAATSIIFGLFLLIVPAVTKIPFGFALVAGAPTVLILGISSIILGIISFFVGRGLWNGKNWARIITIIFIAMGTISEIISIISQIIIAKDNTRIIQTLIQLILYALIVYYLGFNKEVKKAFA